MTTHRKHDTVFYTNTAGTFRARVLIVHRDGDYTVKALFRVKDDGTDATGYLGFNYRIDGSVLRALV